MMHRSKVALVVALGISAVAIYLGWGWLAGLGNRQPSDPPASPTAPERARATDGAADAFAGVPSVEQHAVQARQEDGTAATTEGQAIPTTTKDGRPLPGPQVMKALERAGETLDDFLAFDAAQTQADEERRGMLAVAFEEAFYVMPEARDPDKVFDKWIGASIADSSRVGDASRARCREYLQQFFTEFEETQERLTDQFDLRVLPSEETSLDNFSYRRATGRVQRGTAMRRQLSAYLEQTLGALNGRLAELFGPASDGRPYVEPKARALGPR